MDRERASIPMETIGMRYAPLGERLPAPHRTQALDRLSRVEPKDLGNVEELDEVHPAQARDERLVLHELAASSACVRPAFFRASLVDAPFRPYSDVHVYRRSGGELCGSCRPWDIVDE
jgi:hypothetical protein